MKGAIVAALVFGSALEGSTFIVVKSGDSVVAGADSRVTLTLDYKEKQRGPDACKIHRCAAGRYFIVASNQLVNTKTGIDFSQLASQACAAGGDPKSNADAFQSKAVAAADRILTEDGQATDVAAVFFGYDREPFFYSRSIQRSSTQRTVEPLDCGSGCSQWTAGGYYHAIAKLAPQAFRTSSPEAAVPALIAREIAADKTGAVGPPITVIRVDKSGERWLSPGICAGSK